MIPSPTAGWPRSPGPRRRPAWAAGCCPCMAGRGDRRRAGQLAAPRLNDRKLRAGFAALLIVGPCSVHGGCSAARPPAPNVPRRVQLPFLPPIPEVHAMSHTGTFEFGCCSSHGAADPAAMNFLWEFHADAGDWASTNTPSLSTTRFRLTCFRCCSASTFISGEPMPRRRGHSLATGGKGTFTVITILTGFLAVNGHFP